MDLRVLVLSSESSFGEMVRAQVDNLGCATSLARTYDEGSTALTWAEAAVVDLAGDGVDDLNRMRVEAPTLRILAIAPDEATAQQAHEAGVHRVLTEPFSIPDIGDAVRDLAAAQPAPNVIDLRTKSPSVAPAKAEARWWASK